MNCTIKSSLLLLPQMYITEQLKVLLRVHPARTNSESTSIVLLWGNYFI